MNNPITLSFEYSKELEVKRIIYTINRLDWYLSNKYSLNWMSFPKNINIENLKNLSEKEIIAAIEKEYDEDKYISFVKPLSESFAQHSTHLSYFIENLGLQIIPKIIVNLTFYGMGGSYHPPNKVISNIAKSSGEKLLKTVLHEIIHLHIEYLIKKYEISQWEKETIVNLLFKTAFPDLYTQNNIPPIDTKEIEKIYQTNFPNIEKIISLVKKINYKK